MDISQPPVKNCFHIAIASCFLILIFSFTVFSKNTTSLSGKISSMQTKRSLEGVNVMVKNTTFGAASDDSGYYSIRSIPAGTYTIQVSHIGYKSEIVEKLVINQGENRQLDFELIPTIVKLD